MSEKTRKKPWKYTERHNKILGAICDIMYHQELIEKSRSGSSSDNYEEETSKTFRMTIFPTSKEISQKTGYSKAIVERHLRELKMENFKGTAQSMTPAVISALARNAMTSGKAPEVKLWFQLVEDWEEKSQVKNENSGSLTVKVARKIRKSN